MILSGIQIELMVWFRPMILIRYRISLVSNFSGFFLSKSGGWSCALENLILLMQTSSKVMNMRWQH